MIFSSSTVHFQILNFLLPGQVLPVTAIEVGKANGMKFGTCEAAERGRMGVGCPFCVGKREGGQGTGLPLTLQLPGHRT